MAVAHQPAPAALAHEPGMGEEERRELGLSRPRRHPPGTLAKHDQQRIARDARPPPRQRDNGTLLHGASSRVASTIAEDPPPCASSAKPDHGPKGACRKRYSHGPDDEGIKTDRAEE
jgi:hypothetical protein